MIHKSKNVELLASKFSDDTSVQDNHEGLYAKQSSRARNYLKKRGVIEASWEVLIFDLLNSLVDVSRIENIIILKPENTKNHEKYEHFAINLLLSTVKKLNIRNPPKILAITQKSENLMDQET